MGLVYDAPPGARDFYPITGGFHHRLISERPFGSGRLRFLPAAAGRLERAVLRRSLPYERGEFHLARDQVGCFEFSVEHQCARVPSDVAEHKFHRTRESNRVAFAPAPLCLRRLGRPPRIQPRVQHQETAFSVALRIKPQGAGSLIRERDLHLPPANQIGRLCLTQ
jgi:hypothetical protein